MRGYVLVGCSCLAIAAACGGGKKPAKKPIVKEDKPVEKKVTEEDRAKQRLAEAQEIVPDGSTCLPTSLKAENAPRLELAAIGPDALVCAIDTDESRLLGPVGCWKIDLATGGLAYKSTEGLPGRGFPVKLDDKCARGYCLPKDAKSDGNAHIAWESEGKNVAVLVGDEVHLFDADSKAHASTFSIRGEKGVAGAPTALFYVSGTIAVEGKGEGANTHLWVFKADGTPVGPIAALGGKDERPLSTYKGSVSILDKDRIGVSEHAMETMTVYKISDGTRAKLVRNAKKPACKPAELDAYWQDGDKVGDKCKGSIEALSSHLQGATVVAGAKNFLVLLKGERLGELGVLDAKTLQEKKAIKMPWCSGEAGGAEGAAGGDAGADATKDKEKDKDSKDSKETAKSGTRGATKKTSSDPEEGGE
jgi:hypothetical protein